MFEKKKQQPVLVDTSDVPKNNFYHPQNPKSQMIAKEVTEENEG